MPTPDENTLIEITHKAALVGHQHRVFEEAIAEERVAQVEFLDALVTAAQESLPAICSPIVAFSDEHRGLRIFEVRDESEHEQPSRILYLLEDGRWAYARRTVDGLRLERGVPSRELVDEFRSEIVESAVEAISTAVEGQLRGRKVKHTQRAVAAAEKLRQVTQVVKSL